MTKLIDPHRPITVCKASAGTGKTYTLAAYYVGLLLSGEDYRSILAITFTNKATAEMSERILTYLYALSLGEEKPFLDRARQFMLRDADMPDSELARRAGECFQRMLIDFDNMHVMTIDAFLQSLLSGLAGILRTSAGTSTELDVKHVVKQAVDQLLTDDLTDETLRIIEEYSHYKYTQATSWDIRSEVRQLAEKLYDEKAQLLDNKKQINFDAAFIAQRRKALEAFWLKSPDVVRMLAIVDELEKRDLTMPNGGAIVSAINNIKSSITNPRSLKSTDRFRGLTDNQIEKIESGKWNAIPRDILDKILEATQLIRRSTSLYNTINLTIERSHDMELMAPLQHIIQRNLTEANSALLARTASVLSEALKGGDADFILEKAGIRYHHILMDEFQDTSRLQWEVIKRLLMDVLASEGNTLLIVGDIKQSIYRWRNGDWHIMDGLTSEGMNELTNERLNERFTSLTKNFRSSEEVVQFNLSLFKSIIDTYQQVIPSADEEELKLINRIYGEGFTPDQIDRFYQSDKKHGGYVCFRTFEPCEHKADTQEMMAMEMFRTMEDLLHRGMSPSDMMILLRAKTVIPLLTRMHAELDPNEFPQLTKVPLVSESSFLLGSSTAVTVIIAALRVVMNPADEVAKHQVERFIDKPDIIAQIRERVKKQTPLYEAVSELISMLLTEDGRYEGSQTAYLNSLLDSTREYVHAYGSRIEDFLEYWEDTLKEQSVPASSVGAIRILTIHKSKGLQAQTVFIPFCDWSIESPEDYLWCPVAEELKMGDDQVPVSCGSTMADSAYSKAYEEELKSARVDSLNMLYVAVTRAEDNLFIYTDKPVENHVGRLIQDFLGAEQEERGAIIVKGERRASSDSKDDTKPFAFDSAKEVDEAELWANSDQVRFVQSQEGALYTEYGDEAYRRTARMEDGILCHDIFAHLRKADELDSVLDDFESRGLISSAAKREEIKKLIASAWEGSEEMRDWFTAPWQLHLEEPIYIDNKELRPDRVMINPQTNEAIVLDYKFGHWEKTYIDQVHGYMNALRELNYAPVRGYLWFARMNKLEEVK